MFGNKKNQVTDIEKALYENEIKSLRSELANVSRQLEIANKYKNEYKKLTKEYK